MHDEAIEEEVKPKLSDQSQGSKIEHTSEEKKNDRDQRNPSERCETE
jgi:hypothetical protein